MSEGDSDFPLGTVAFFIALIFPFFTVLRWRGFGFFVAVILGWAVIHASNLIASVEAPVDAVFKGVWAIFGWAYMLAWCTIVFCVMVASWWIGHRLWDTAAPDQPIKFHPFPADGSGS